MIAASIGKLVDATEPVASIEAKLCSFLAPEVRVFKRCLESYALATAALKRNASKHFCALFPTHEKNM